MQFTDVFVIIFALSPSLRQVIYMHGKHNNAALDRQSCSTCTSYRLETLNLLLYTQST